MLHLPTDLKNLYPAVPEEAIHDAVELAAIRVMSQCMRAPATATIDEEGLLHINLLKETGQEEISVNGLKNKVKRRLLDEIELELMRRQACYDSWHYKTILHSVLTGQIERIMPDRTLIARIEINDMLTSLDLSAECPLVHQPVHERERYTVGDTLEFFIQSCLPVASRRHAKVRIIASRVARELPSRMLGKLTGLTGIRCTKRIPGGDTWLVSRHWIPNNAIVTVGNKLRERLHVKCLAKPQKG